MGGTVELKDIKRLLRRILGPIKRGFNALGSKHQCYICRRTFSRFRPYKKCLGFVSSWFKHLEIGGYDPERFQCVFCMSFGRERHLSMYFDKLNLWDELRGYRILHISPERHIRRKIRELAPKEYVQGDVVPWDAEIRQMDVTNIDCPDEHFDFVICNHVLEHVEDDRSAMNELFRVLKPGGKAVLQTPFSGILRHSFEDPGINTDELRERFYGEAVHYRVYGQDLFDRLEAVGFRVRMLKHKDYLSDYSGIYYGVDPKEDMIMVSKEV